MLNRIKMMWLLSGSLGAFAAGQAQAVSVPFAETFDTGVSGWENNIQNPLTFGATGGSDGGGYASGTFNFNGFVPGPGGSGPIVLRASAADNASGGAFLGNWLTAGVGSVTAMVRHNAPEAITYFLRLATAANSPAGAFQLSVSVEANVWTQITFPISSCTDAGPPGACAAALAAVGNLQIGTSAPVGLRDDDVAYAFDVDQVSLNPIPEPGTAVLFG
ncbi:hypothetical protein K2X89_08780, partial [Myxococcota bacterium]|nr:hypothetical protein [Myxococcota bacterium]